MCAREDRRAVPIPELGPGRNVLIGPVSIKSPCALGRTLTEKHEKQISRISRILRMTDQGGTATALLFERTGAWMAGVFPKENPLNLHNPQNLFLSLLLQAQSSQLTPLWRQSTDLAILARPSRRPPR